MDTPYFVLQYLKKKGASYDALALAMIKRLCVARVAERIPYKLVYRQFDAAVSWDHIVHSSRNFGLHGCPVDALLRVVRTAPGERVVLFMPPLLFKGWQWVLEVKHHDGIYVQSIPVNNARIEKNTWVAAADYVSRTSDTFDRQSLQEIVML